VGNDDLKRGSLETKSVYTSPSSKDQATGEERENSVKAFLKNHSALGGQTKKLEIWPEKGSPMGGADYTTDCVPLATGEGYFSNKKNFMEGEKNGKAVGNYKRGGLKVGLYRCQRSVSLL